MSIQVRGYERLLAAPDDTAPFADGTPFLGMPGFWSSYFLGQGVAEEELRRCIQVTVPRDEGKKPLVARFGGIPLKRQRTAVLTDIRPVMASMKRNELIHRLLAECCEMCEARTNLEVHHVRKLADLNRPGRREKPAWVRLMAMRRRKTLVICRRCHEGIHAGRPTAVLRK
ncbi:hypothetical protein OH809_42750 [Streptomyces sp. NBC_00873]|uniref:HNH endonuclease n=1 Tax=unclassified Streptomyces TaxID=2593676 RepID=UPI003868CC4D|nr:hypothetical protein OH809_00960 [Streptomyces sp. NBC_00873]WSY96780.1 hypothetical protein OH809_42750 [Streptomyces sp. NBC_00873]WTA41446.1 hypothetical protein OH821_00950 [Streptomyces sp. NBC_00842]WTA48451.1 hypothetical protein OH821_42865 [Streptomyces sp. NBC_00842]